MTNNSENSDDEKLDVSETVSELNEITSKGVIHDLLGPSAKQLGAFLGERTRDFIQKKRSKNLQGHIDKVIEAQPRKMIDVTPKKVTQLEKWCRDAQDVEEDQPEAALWRAMLDEIMVENSNDLLLSVAHQLNREDLVALSELERSPKAYTSRTMDGIKRLEALGLVRSEVSGSHNIRTAGLLLTVGLILLLLGMYVYFWTDFVTPAAERLETQSSTSSTSSDDSSNPFLLLQTLLVFVGGGACMTAIVVGIRELLKNSIIDRKPALTELGLRLMKKIKLYQK